MRYRLLVFLLLSISFACTSDNKQASVPIVGNDTDKYGCKASTGERWSQLEQNCVRLSTQGIRLYPKSESLDATLSAFILFRKKDDARVELFMPKATTSKILEKSTSANETWQINDLKLVREQGKYRLKLGEQLLYQEE